MVELGRSAVHGNHYIFARFVSGSLDGGNDGVQGIFCTLQIRSKTSFIAYCCAEATVFQDFFSAWNTSAPIRKPSRKEVAPTGRIMNSWKAMGASLCEPPLMMFIIGTGIT